MKSVMPQLLILQRFSRSILLTVSCKTSWQVPRGQKRSRKNCCKNDEPQRWRQILPLSQWIQRGSENSEIAGYVAQSVARWKPDGFYPFAADERSKEPSSAQHCTDCHIRHGACACVAQIAMRILLVCICVACSGFLTLLSRVLGKSI